MLLRQHAEVDSTRIIRGGVPVFRRPTRSGSSRKRERAEWTADHQHDHRCSYPDDMNFTVEERPNGEHDGFGTDFSPIWVTAPTTRSFSTIRS